MGLFDSISSIFSGGGGTAGGGGYTGTPDPWLAVIGQLASSFKATPRAGATEKDRNKANMINMFSSLLGSGLTSYSAQQDQTAKQQAMNELMSIYQRGGNPNMQGPVMPGQAPLDQGLTESIFGWGQKNPGLAPLSMELGLKARATDLDTQRWEQDRQFKIDQAKQAYDLDKLRLNQQQAYQNASLGLERERLGVTRAQAQAEEARKTAELSAPFTQLERLGKVFGTDAVTALAPSILGGGNVQTPTLGTTPTAQPNQYMTPMEGGGATTTMLNPLQAILGDIKAKKTREEERPYIADSLQRLQTADQSGGWSKNIGRYDSVLEMLDSGNYAQQMNALKSLTQMIDNSVVQSGELNTAQQMLISNADAYTRNLESWLGSNKKPLTKDQLEPLREMARIYAGGAQSALKSRMSAERKQLEPFVRDPESKLTLFDEYLSRDFSKSNNQEIIGLTGRTR